MFFLKKRPLAGSCGYGGSHRLRRDAKHVQVGCFPSKSVILTNCEAADTMQVRRLIQQSVEIGKKRKPWLRGRFSVKLPGHWLNPRIASNSQRSSAQLRVTDALSSISASNRAYRPSRT